MTDWIPSIAALAVVALLLGAGAMWRRADRRRAALMAVAALVIAGNIAIWSWPIR